MQVHNGGLAERVSVEGAMLQYVVDVRLDEALSIVWHQVCLSLCVCVYVSVCVCAGMCT